MSRLPQPRRTLTSELKGLKRTQRTVARRSAFTGSGMTVLGNDQTLFAPGIISNDALSSPSVPGVATLEVTNFAVGLTLAEVAGVDLIVPTGTSGLMISGTAHVFVSNTVATADVLWASLRVAVTSSLPLGVVLPASSVATASCSLGTVLTGLLAGDVVRLGVWASVSTTARAANTANTASLTAALTWTP